MKLLAFVILSAAKKLLGKKTGKKSVKKLNNFGDGTLVPFVKSTLNPVIFTGLKSRFLKFKVSSLFWSIA